MALRGGNLEEMHQLAKMFTANATKLNGIINDLNSRTAGSQDIWTGPGGRPVPLRVERGEDLVREDAPGPRRGGQRGDQERPEHRLGHALTVGEAITDGRRRLPRRAGGRDGSSSCPTITGTCALDPSCAALDDDAWVGPTGRRFAGDVHAKRRELQSQLAAAVHTAKAKLQSLPKKP